MARKYFFSSVNNAEDTCSALNQSQRTNTPRISARVTQLTHLLTGRHSVQLCQRLRSDAMRCDALCQGHHRPWGKGEGGAGKSGRLCVFLWVLRVLGYFRDFVQIYMQTIKICPGFQVPRSCECEQEKRKSGKMGARDCLPIRHVCLSSGLPMSSR